VVERGSPSSQGGRFAEGFSARRGLLIIMTRRVGRFKNKKGEQRCHGEKGRTSDRILESVGGK